VLALVTIAVIGIAIAVAARRDGGEVAQVEPPQRAERTRTTVTFEESTLVLLVSNQSYDRPAVGMRVEVDGEVIANQVFTHGSGHTYASFPLKIDPGPREVTVVADDGTTLEVTVDLPAERRWLTVLYWSGGDQGRHFSHRLDDAAPGIA
jgi:hypothetical protein